MSNVSDDQLREMAQHRGMKLVKSRKRKPGVGDFGKFGLTDASGKALLGFGEDGLTASAADIQDYLRTSEQGTWKQSAETTPDRPASYNRQPLPESRPDDAPVRRRPARAPKNEALRRSPDRRLAGRQNRPNDGRPNRASSAVTQKAPELRPQAKSQPEPVLRIRAAAAADSAAISILLRQLNGVTVSKKEVAENLAMALHAKGGMVVAEEGEIVGCCAWVIVHTVHRGPIGRLTVLVVDKKHRRRGLGTQMLKAVEAAMTNAGCRQVEAMSDITVDNSHNFFRSLKFEQASYRFVLRIGTQSETEKRPVTG